MVFYSIKTKTILAVSLLVLFLESVTIVTAMLFLDGEAYGTLYAARNCFLAGSLAASLPLLLIVWPLVMYLTRPLQLFPKQMEKLPDMEGTQGRVPIHSNDEIGILVQTFNRMAIELGQRKSANKAELDLEGSRDFYLTLFENFPALIRRSGTDAMCNYFNKTWLEFTGRTTEQENGDGWMMGVHPEDLDFCVTTYLDAYHARKPFEMEYRLRHKEGEYRCVVDMGRPFYGPDGDFAGYIGTCFDVTGREEAANHILKLSRVIEPSPNLVVIATLAGTIEYVNHRAIEATGYSVEELVGQNIKLLSPPEAAYEVEQALHEVVDLGKEWRGEIPARKKEGQIFWEQVTISSIKTLVGKITHVVCIKEDITLRKQSELSLRESEERYRQLFENNPHPMWAYDLETLVFLAVNNAAVRHYGYSREEFLAMNIKALRSPEEIDNAAKGAEEIYEAGVRRHVKKDGTVILVEITSNVMLFAGRKAEIVLANDVTEKILAKEEKLALEHRLSQSQKMEAIGSLAGGIAHDFNNILTTIIGYATLMQAETKGDDVVQWRVSHILSASNRAANLTNSLLAYSRKQISNPTSVKINSIITNFETLLRRLIPESIEFKYLLTEEELTVMADSGQIEQILMNLIVNARDAMCEGGELLIATEPITLDRDFAVAHGQGTAGSYALLTVSDSGVGMDEKTMNKIFEPFFTTKEVGKGTGLGLAIVYGIVKEHNGYINCSSEPGRGTVFRIYLPLVDAPVRNMVESADQVVAGGNETILLVEDDADLREMLGELLEGYGYTVIKAVDGEDAVQKFEKDRDNVQMVILDVVMPKMNGKGAYDIISAISPQVRVLFMSGYTADIVTKKFIVENTRPFVSKPIVIKELLIEIRKELDTC